MISMGTRYVQYRPELYASSMADASILEETRPGAISPDLEKQILEVNPFALIDRDGDGLREVDLADMDRVRLQNSFSLKPCYDYLNFTCFLPSPSFPLATYFNDEKNVSVSGDRLTALPRAMRPFTRDHDFGKAREYFAQEYRKSGSLSVLAERLALHLSATAIHSASPFEGNVLLENENGFSRTREGFLRFNCTLFIQLAHSDLKDISHLKFTYLYYSKESDPDAKQNFTPPDYSRLALADYQKTQAVAVLGDSAHPVSVSESPALQSVQSQYTHMSLVVTGNVHLLIDNDRVTVLPKKTDPIAYLRARWSNAGYEKIYTDPTFEGVLNKAYHRN